MEIRLFALTCALAALIFPQTATAQLPPIIDVHLHSYRAESFSGPLPPNSVTGVMPTATTPKENMQATLAQLEKFNIVLGIVSGPLDSVDAWRQAAPDRIIAGAYEGPRGILPDVAVLLESFESGRLQVMGELGFQYHGLTPNESRLEPYFRLAEEMGIPVAIHTGLAAPNTPYKSCCPDFRVTLGNPEHLEEVLVRHPKLRVYLMHAGYPYLQETKAIMYMYPQVYADLAIINWVLPREEFHSHLKALIDGGYGKRLMFGSDSQLWPEAIEMAIQGIESADFLSNEQKRDIFYNNAARFLRLSQEDIVKHHRE
jgi:predicted TIM-barrel fold metal-dependent hydrolase